ncbi:primosomal protein N' [Fictibacillus sp. Mic-4]|uniref:primosomal protein N' n=1 Tax=Fictibacillus sp. Mic-4 TaxID=3132826 RepID=UPI003CF7728B
MIAKVIVDVPANTVNRSFDYKVPEKWTDTIQPGMRVVVPFGPRKLQGFVIELCGKSEAKRLKEIDELLDPVPVLTDELIELGKWLAKETLCFLISAYQVMLPSAMKATYKKEFRLLNENESLPAEISEWFKHRKSVPLEDVLSVTPSPLSLFQKLVKEKKLEVIYQIKDKAAVKTVKLVKANGGRKEIERYLDSLMKQALKQKEILNYFLSHNEAVPIGDLIDMFDTTRSTIQAMVKKGFLVLVEQEVYRNPYDKNYHPSKPLMLTTEQQKAIQPILRNIENGKHETLLIHGVTGSGKTEIYLQSIQEAITKGKEAIVLVPEIALTPQMVTRFKERFGSHVAVLHSGLSIGEKYDEWRKIHRKEVSVVVGARSAVFAPFENLGLIIIDEEHESSYKQEENPRYHARDVAIWRGKFHQCPVVLGSATPSLESYARAQRNVYTLCELKERVNNRELPAVSVIDMREELRAGNRSMFSRELYSKLSERIEKGEQSVLLLNRRGYSTFVLCRDCGYVAGCPHCDISLTYHKKHHLLKCHYCGYQEGMPSVCPSCYSEHIRFFGTGTQKVEEELAKILPEAKVIRMDVDTTSRKGSHEKLLNEFGSGAANILLGTQMIAKGLDFPKVTLVGVLAADTMLHLPDFRASEKTFQLLTQVSGRAGRHALKGEVVIQSYTCSHYSIQLAAEHDYLSFYKKEMGIRKAHQYPPYYYLSLVTISHPDLMKVVSVSEKIAAFLKRQMTNETIVLGPVASPLSRIKDRYRYAVMVKYRNEPRLDEYFSDLIHHYQREISSGELQLSIDMNALNMM